MLRTLTTLAVNLGEVSDEGVAAEPWIRAVERLVLRFIRPSPRGIAALRGALGSPDARITHALAAIERRDG